MWKKETSSLGQSLLSNAVGLIFNYDEHWLTFLYSHKNGEMRASPHELIKDACCYSHGEQIKIRVALDLLTGHGHVTIAELVDVLDFENLLRVILAIMMVRDIAPCDLDDLLSRRYEDADEE